METAITVTFGLTGAHRFPNSKDLYLAQRHPHEFGFSVSIREKVPREIEWIDFRHWLMDTFKMLFKAQLPSQVFAEFGDLSCEEIAVELAKIVAQRHVRETVIVVSEEDEYCGAEIRFTEQDMQNLKDGKPLVRTT